MEEQYYLTQEGAVRLKEELGELTGPAREQLAQRLRAAIQQGDLSENADYHKAKEDQAFLEGRIQELEHILKNATLIDEDIGERTIVDIGARVTVQEDDYPSETYRLVGATEANPRNGNISNESPIGKALIGHSVGDQVRIETPDGQVILEILKIE
jgi:transcription elongation factor GreA